MIKLKTDGRFVKKGQNLGIKWVLNPRIYYRQPYKKQFGTDHVKQHVAGSQRAPTTNVSWTRLNLLISLPNNSTILVVHLTKTLPMSICINVNTGIAAYDGSCIIACSFWRNAQTDETCIFLFILRRGGRILGVALDWTISCKWHLMPKACMLRNLNNSGIPAFLSLINTSTVWYWM